jgi:hypothetical protein
MSFGDAKRLLSQVAPTKVKHLASQAKALDISELQDEGKTSSKRAQPFLGDPSLRGRCI